MVTEYLKSINHYEALIHDINTADYISFDVFDTLLLRNVLHPVDLFKIVEIEYRQRYGAEISFSKAREQAEMSARLKSTNEDITYDEIYTQLQLNLGQEVTHRCKKIELELEEEFLIANTDMQAIFNYAIKANKKVLIISDMYLSSDFIGSILTKCGYTGEFELYVSCEVNASKASGSLYKWVANQYNIQDTSKWLHIGDNKGADINNAKHYGLRTYYYKRLAEREHAYYKKSNYSLGYSVMSSIQINNKYLNGLDDYWYDFGITIASSIYYDLTSWLVTQIQHKDHIFFLGRDGYIPYKIYSWLRERNDSLPKAQYLMASRRAYVYPTLLDLAQEDALDYLLLYNDSFNQKLLLSDLLNNLGLPSEKYNTQLIENNIDINTVINDHTKSNVKNFLKQIWEDIVKQLKAEKDALFKYFELMGVLDASEVNVFDIGWAGSTQQALKQLLHKKINGYYFATHENVKAEMRQEVTSYLFHLGQPLHLNKKVMLNVMMYEFLFSAPTESLIKFSINEQGELIPITKNVENNTLMYKAIEAILSGALHVIEALESNKKYINSVTKDEAIYAYQALIEQKNANDLTAFSLITNSVGIGDTKDVQRYVGVYELEEYRESMVSIYANAHTFLWRNAILITTNDGRKFSSHEANLLYRLRTGKLNYTYKKLNRLFLKAIKHPDKAIKKAINIVMALLKK